MIRDPLVDKKLAMKERLPDLCRILKAYPFDMRISKACSIYRIKKKCYCYFIGWQLERLAHKINEVRYDVPVRNQSHFACSVVDWDFEQKNAQLAFVLDSAIVISPLNAKLLFLWKMQL